jgi:GT2 family glycosyltransferase
VVTDGWLDQLIALTRVSTVETHTEDASRQREEPNELGRGVVGLVGPMSNYAAPPQWVEDVPYRDLEEMQSFARRWRDEHRGWWFTVPKLSGFCLLMTRAVLERVGSLDERFHLGFFDDDDLAVRARRAGFELAVAHDLFIHHFGSRTFAGNGIDAEALLEANARRFAAKWGQELAGGRPVALRPWTQPGSGPGRGAAGDEEPLQGRRERDARFSIPDSKISEFAEMYGLAPAPLAVAIVSPSDGEPPAHAVDRSRLPGADRPGPRARVSLTLIVRDEQENLPKCLASVQGIFEEIVVVDTGSVDRTKEIAAEFGARVFDFPWVDSFSAARNAALAHATGDYAFWLDADDVVDPPSGRTCGRCWSASSGPSPPGRASLLASRWRRRLGRSLALPGRRALPGRALGAGQPPTWCAAPATRAMTAAAAGPSSITSGSFPAATACAGPTASTSRSCRHFRMRGFPSAGPTSWSGTPVTPTQNGAPRSWCATSGWRGSI